MGAFVTDFNFLWDTGFLIIFNTVSFVAAMLAALFWYRSARVEVPYDHERVDQYGMKGGGIIIEHSDGRQIDPFETAAKANQWNARAAICAAVAAFFQALAYFFPARESIRAAASDLWGSFLTYIPFI